MKPFAEITEFSCLSLDVNFSMSQKNSFQCCLELPDKKSNLKWTLKDNSGATTAVSIGSKAITIYRDVTIGLA